MRELLGRVSTLDPEAGAAVKVIAYFDELADAGIEPVVRGAAVLTGVAAGFVDSERDLALLVAPTGAVERHPIAPAPSWCSAQVGGGLLWLELTEEPGPAEAMVLERAATTVRTRLRHTVSMNGGRAALAQTLVDPDLPEEQRARAARRYGIVPGSLSRAVAVHGGAVRVVAADQTPGPGRIGVGPAIEALALPRSWRDARRALRFTARGTGAAPDPRVALAEELGGLLLCACKWRWPYDDYTATTERRDRSPTGPGMRCPTPAPCPYAGRR